MSQDIVELTPSVPSGDVEVWLVTTGRQLDGVMITTAHHSEADARGFLTNATSNDWQRCAAITMVRIPRSLIKERWTHV